MSHFDKSGKVEQPNLEDNIFWQKRQLLCYFAKINGRSAEDESLRWVSGWKWCDINDPVLSRSNTNDLIKVVAMLHQWLIVLSTIPQDIRDKWANEYASTYESRGAQ